MRENFKGNKRRKEELRKQKQEQKRNKRLNRKAQAPLTDVLGAVPSGEGILPPPTAQGQ